MSVAVEPRDLASAAAGHGPTAFVLTVGDDGRTRVIHVKVDIDGRGVIRAVVGRGAAANAVARPDVVVLWSPAADGFSLIADGVASVDGEPRPDTPITIEVLSAVRHRPAPV
ncbi:MAG: hypothetical protein OXL98_01330 [Acidimicrobiaceae bacterium]|nr:hypothetical protein [Acidimicrobiaceae bacterium]